NGDGTLDEPAGPINSLTVMSDAAPDYAPEGQSLVSVTVLCNEAGDPLGDEAAVRGQLVDWYGDAVAGWRLIEQHDIRHALPDQRPEAARPAVDLPAGVHACGDWTGAALEEGASINSALASGHAAAIDVLRDTPVGG
ncbi:MAG: amine oxidase, partial [Planctomycetota bacterium]